MLTLAFSPCPNDTFIFDALVHQRINMKNHRFEVSYEDVETLNQHAVQRTYDVTKLSFHAWLKVSDHYQILSAGGALGRGNGPLLVARPGFGDEDLSKSRVAVPGALTTANMLMKLAYPRALSSREYVFSDVMRAILSGEVDAGILIHETRFTYRERGLSLIRDLGAYWEELTGLPIPLGCIAIRRDLNDKVKLEVNELIRSSLDYGWQHPELSQNYIAEHAQELDHDIIKAHIETFVNPYSQDLGDEGRRAVEALCQQALAEGLIDEIPMRPWLVGDC